MQKPAQKELREAAHAFVTKHAAGSEAGIQNFENIIVFGLDTFPHWDEISDDMTLDDVLTIMAVQVAELPEEKQAALIDNAEAYFNTDA